LLPDNRIADFGENDTDPNDPEGHVLARRGLYHYPAEGGHGRPQDAAAEAQRHLAGVAPQFLVHFDVDVIDCIDFRVADVPQFNKGLSFAEALPSLGAFVSSPQFAGLVDTEFTPDHADEDGKLAAVLAQGIADVLTPAGSDTGTR